MTELTAKQLLRILRQKVGNAIGRFDLISEGDNIAVGVSGGKDSLTLLYQLANLRRYSPVRYELQAVMLGLQSNVPTAGVEAFCRELAVPFHYVPTQIGAIVFEARQEKNPCSLCANLRRGALNNMAKALGCNKVALGHHQDDVIETLLLSLFFEGRVHTFSPRTFLSRKELTVIRPLVFTPEAVTRRLSELLRFPVVDYCCPASGQTQRQSMKELIASLESDYPALRRKLLSAIQNIDIDPLWGKEPTTAALINKAPAPR